MDDERNLTPEQLRIPRPIRAEAYRRLPMTCKCVRTILEEVRDEVMIEYEIPPEDIAGIDEIVSRAFMRIRGEVTQPFRTEQMLLLAQAMMSEDERKGYA